MKALTREEQLLPRTPRLAFPDTLPSEGMYARISVRWAIFFYLAEHVKERPQAIGSIAAALKAGGSATKGQNFNSNVSAVLSQMVAKGELTKSDEGFAISDLGWAAWHAIKNSEKFITQAVPVSEEGEVQ